MKIARPESKQPMPPDARRVFQGVIFDVYQWEQKMFDGRTATFEKLKRQDTTVVVPITADGKIVVTEELQPGRLTAFLGVAGGRVEPGESPLDNAKRELREETGYEAERWTLWFAEQPVLKMEWAIYTFIARDCRKVGEPAPDSGEKIKAREISFEEFTEFAVRDGFHELGIKLEFLKAKCDLQKMTELKKLFLE